MIPGVSRSAATIMAGLALGVDRRTIVEFSFLLAIPTMVAASGYDIYRNYAALTLVELDLILVGFGVSFALAVVSIRWLIGFVQTHTFVPFGIYRIVVALVFWLFVLR
jgi:undecaprenyl-diphosphatase